MTQDLPLVSIAIITYNQKKYLQECIESILNQEYKNIEIVIADDCSTDGTREMLIQYANKYKNKFILKLSNKNQGITKNSNLAYFACNGKYIAWMGGDDIMYKDKIKKQVEIMEKNPDCSICYHNLEVFDSLTGKTIRYFNNFSNKHTGDISKLIKYGTFNGACSTMVRKDKCPIHGFNEQIPYASDWLFWVETLANGGNIYFIDEVLGRYRRHENNITNPKDKGRSLLLWKDHLDSINILLIKYPQYTRELLYRYSEIIYGFRKLNSKYYLQYVIESLRIRIRIKPLIYLILFIISMGSLKK